ncbi:MAG: Uma2 family endonuclease [Cyanobium sp.]
MTLAAPPPSTPTTQQQESELQSLRLPWDLRLTAEQFERVCQVNPEAVLELSADGQVLAMTPTGGETSARNLRLGQRLLLWAEGAGAGGWRVFDSSGGFRIPPHSVHLGRSVALSPIPRSRSASSARPTTSTPAARG